MICWLQAQQRDLSFCVFARTNPVRKVAILIVENPWFNRLVLAIIMANCVFLAIANPQCDTEVEIANKPECAGNPKWQRVGLPFFQLFIIHTCNKRSHKWQRVHLSCCLTAKTMKSLSAMTGALTVR